MGTPLGLKYIPYTYMDPLGLKARGLPGGSYEELFMSSVFCIMGPIHKSFET